MATPPRLSVCFIVRDEAPRLAAAIESVRAVADDIVVVDTGSTDGTRELAQHLGARVFDTPWQDDFSAARNVALAAARGQWILSLDADQRLVADSLDRLRQALDSTAWGQAVTIRMLSEAGSGGAQGTYRAARLFRRDDRIRYTGKVHEDVAPSLAALGATDLPDSGVVLDDIGYIDAHVRQQKLARNERLLWQALADNPANLFAAHKLLQTLTRDDARRLAVWHQARLQMCASPPEALAAWPFVPRLIEAGIDTDIRLGELASALEWAPRLAQSCTPEQRHALGILAARAGDEPLARQWLGMNAQGILWRARLARLLGDPTSATQWLEHPLLALDERWQALARCEALHLTIDRGDLSQAAIDLSALTPLARQIPELARETLLLAARVARASGQPDDARRLAQAAIHPDNDQAAAWLVDWQLHDGQTPDQHWLASIPGQRFDTLAVRLRLQQHLGMPSQPPPTPAILTGVLMRSAKGR